jgi:hypothetical protein|nr:hypothetical protein [Kofleriaceae bacterium]
MGKLGGLVCALVLTSSAAFAQTPPADSQPAPPATPPAAPPALPQPPTVPQPPTMPSGPIMPAPPTIPTDFTPTTQTLPSTAGGPAMPQPDLTAMAAHPENEHGKEPQAGDFDAGGKLRLPNGPDAMGHYKSFNWVAVDLEGRYYLARTVWLSGVAPVAIIHPDSIMEGAGTAADSVDPKMFGGLAVSLNANLPEMPKVPFMKYKTELGLVATVSYMHEGAPLLSDKDFPLFVGDFQPGFTGGLVMKVKLGDAVDFALTPSWVFQSGTVQNHDAVQIPMSLILSAGELVKLTADLGVYTGDQYSFSGDDGGRITAGGSLQLKIAKLVFHAGAGVASLLTGGLYPTIADSIYFDLNVKYAK